MISQQRLQIEKQVLDFGFPKRYVFHNLGTSNEWLELGLRTNAGRTYNIKVVLGNFPFSRPDVYVLYPANLRDYRGKYLKAYGADGGMHLLPPDSAGNIQLCHYGNRWHENVTLYKVALKCLVWLNAYDGHLRTGQPIDHYLKHQPM
jgi:hypothetical protein